MPKKIILLLLIWTTSCFADYQYDLSACMIFRDEAPFLKEWIEFHRLVGVQHFYLGSHNSQDNYRKVLKPYIEKGIVELTEIVVEKKIESHHEFNTIQLNFYNDCLAKTKSTSKWVAFIDSDEYLFPTQVNNLVDFLKDFASFGGVAANWQMFGTSDIEKLRPDVLMIEQLVRCAPPDLEEVNLPVKCIVQPKRVAGFETNPHHPTYIPPHYHVNTNKEPFAGPFSPYILVNQLRINHYWTRDEDYFWNHKIPRQTKWLGWTAEDIKHIPEKYNQYSDFSIQRFVPKLRKRMKL